MSQLGQFAVVRDLAGAEVFLEAERRGHKPDDAGHSSSFPGRSRRLLSCFPAASTPNSAEVNAALERGACHATFSLRSLASSPANVLMPDGRKVIDTLPAAPSYATSS